MACERGTLRYLAAAALVASVGASNALGASLYPGDLLVASGTQLIAFGAFTDVPRVIFSGLPAAITGIEVDASLRVFVLAGYEDPRVIRIDVGDGSQEVIAAGGLLRGAADLGVDQSGTLFVADSFSGIIRVDPDTGAQSLLFARSQFFRLPVRVAIAGRTLYAIDSVSGQHDERILAIDLDSGVGSIVSSGGLLYLMSALAVAPNGDLLLADSQRVVRVDPTSGTQTLVFSEPVARSIMDVALRAGTGELFLSHKSLAGGPERGRLARLVLANGSLSELPEVTPIGRMAMVPGLDSANTAIGECSGLARILTGDIDECTADLQECFTPEFWDQDGDGESDWNDRCPGSSASQVVDDAGCTLEQFCSSLADDTRLCRRADWRGDEPLVATPEDCRAAPSGGCVASTSCGDVLTENRLLDRDLLCAGDGLIIGANGVRLDLGGHAIRGLGEDAAARGVGIRNDGFDDVRVENGTIAGFSIAIAESGGARGGWLRGLRIEDIPREAAIAAVVLENTHHTRVTGCVFTNDGGSLYLGDARDNTIEDNSFSGGDSDYVNVAVRLERSARNLLLRNKFSAASKVPLFLVDSDENRLEGNSTRADYSAGLRNSHRNRIRRNQLIGREDSAGLVLVGSHGNRIEENEIVGDSRALQLLGCNDGLIRKNGLHSTRLATLTLKGNRNRVEGNSVSGVHSGIHLESGAGNRLIGNSVEQATQRCLSHPSSLCSASDGILVSAPAEESRVEQNQVRGFLDDGLDLQNATTRLQGNVAEGNGDFGIQAIEGVRDRGGNRASGNGNPAECLNVACN